ncbi:aminotransferase [Labrys monachus]|uniref:L-2,4-diaminobutyrate transaminase n=1 Tax=Labrys monachus TaxID=217067 RepID=A0ABU0F8Q4_9HYPH|nr:aminotransferase [Labrys monachus]MDQ0390524.1 L-2,4-diaminobutyrate transaminase [Labrys monachus]
MHDLLRNTPDLETLDKRYFFHPFTALADHERNGPHVVVKGEGVWLEDNHGARFIDGMAGLWCVNVGYGREEIADVLQHQALTLPYFHSFSSWATDTPILLAERLIEMAPVPMSKVFFGQSGSDANDTQVKLVWYYNNARGKPGKKKIIARNRGYHGVTIVSGSLTGMPSLHSGFDLPLSFVRHTTAPYRLWEAEPGLSDEDFVARLAGDLENLILAEGPETVGAVIMEPVMGAGGVIVPPEGYYPAIRAVLDRHDVLLIADEVITGFGRLGTMFGTTAMAMQPDLVTLAKGITSAYVPLSACMVSEKVWRAIVDGQGALGAFGHGYTYSAHPLAAAAALANLDIIENDGLVEQAGARGAFMHARLQAAFADHPLVGEIRGTGLVGAVEFVARKSPATRFEPALKIAGRVVKAALAQGVITRALPHADTISFSPPFVISEDEITQMVEGARKAADAVMDDLVREKIWSA